MTTENFHSLLCDNTDLPTPQSMKTLFQLAIFVVCQFVDGQAVRTLHVCVRASEMCQDLGSACKPTAAPTSGDGTQHIPSSTDFQIQFFRHSFADDASTALCQYSLPIWSSNNFAWETSLATRCSFPAFHSAVLHWLPRAIFVKLMPMMLDSTEYELHIRVKLLAKSITVCQSF